MIFKIILDALANTNKKRKRKKNPVNWKGKNKTIFIHRPHYYYFSPLALWILDRIPETGWLMNHPVVIKNYNIFSHSSGSWNSR